MIVHTGKRGRRGDDKASVIRHNARTQFLSRISTPKGNKHDSTHRSTADCRHGGSRGLQHRFGSWPGHLEGRSGHFEFRRGAQVSGDVRRVIAAHALRAFHSVEVVPCLPATFAWRDFFCVDVGAPNAKNPADAARPGFVASGAHPYCVSGSSSAGCCVLPPCATSIRIFSGTSCETALPEGSVVTSQSALLTSVNEADV